MLLWALPAVSAGQTRTLAGRVIDGVSGRGIDGGSVTVLETEVTDVLRPDGVFVLRVPPGPLTLVFRLPGYPRLVADVRDDQDVFLVSINPDPVRLVEISTGKTAGEVEEHATVVGPDIARVPSASFVDALGSRVPGAVVARNSGAPAGLRHIQIRGISTLLAATAPLVVVDGVVIRSTGGADGSSVVTGGLDQNADRLVDLSPYDIASVQLLKGAAATSRYGSRGANGVLIITTRRR